MCKFQASAFCKSIQIGDALLLFCIYRDSAFYFVLEIEISMKSIIIALGRLTSVKVFFLRDWLLFGCAVVIGVIRVSP